MNFIALECSSAETDKTPHVRSKSHSPQYLRLDHKGHRGPGEETLSYHLSSPTACLQYFSALYNS